MKNILNTQKREDVLVLTSKPYGSVLIKAVQILDFLSERDEPQMMKAISDNTNMTLPTTNKILDTLELVGFVSRNQETKEYSLGPRLIQLANASFIQFDIVRETYPALKRLFETVGTTVNLGMLQGDEVLFINKFTVSDTSNKTLSRIGFTQPIYCSAMGKAMLSTFSLEDRKKYFNQVELTPNTKYTITNKKELEKQLIDIEEKGYATDDREAEDNIYCIGTTFETSNDNGHYAFSISIPYHLLTEEKYDFLVSELIKTKNVIEYQLANLK